MITLTAIALLIATAAAHAARTPAEQVARTITATWTCQDAIGQKRTKAGNVWAKHSRGYRQWQLRVWTARLEQCNARRAVVRTLQRGLAGTPMAGTEAALEAAGRQHGISPYFIAAVAGTESSFGAAACRGAPFNAFGLASCGTSWRVPYFPTWRSAYLFMGSFLTSRWPSATTTMHYYGYAANSSAWGAKCAYWMRERFGVGNSVRYG